MSLADAVTAPVIACPASASACTASASTASVFPAPVARGGNAPTACTTMALADTAAATLQAQTKKPRRRPSWMGECQAGAKAVKKEMTFPLDVLTLALDLEAARASIASREKSSMMRDFLESEVHAVMLVTERTFTNDAEEQALHSELRSAAGCVVAGVEGLLDDMFVELGDRNWPRANYYDQLVAHARELSLVYTGAEMAMYHPEESDLDGLEPFVADAFASGVLENPAERGMGIDVHPWGQ